MIKKLRKGKAQGQGKTIQNQIELLFQNYDKDGDSMMSVGELNQAIADKFGFNLTNEESQTLKEFFKAKYKRNSIRKFEFNELIDSQNARQWDTKQAKMALRDVKKALNAAGKTVPNLFKEHMIEDFPNDVHLRGFKYGLNTLKCLTAQQINNLAKYLDFRNDGFISLSHAEKAVENPDSYQPNMERSLSKNMM